MSNSFPQLGLSLIDIFFSFIIFVFTLRLLMSFFSTSAYNPITQSLIKISRPILVFFFFIPNLNKFELSSLFVIFLSHFLNFFIQSSLRGVDIFIEPIIIFAIKSSIFSILNVLSIIFIILALSSWFVQSSQSNRNPALDIIYQISTPILFFIKRLVPTSIGVIDFSVIIVLVLIIFIKNIVNIIL